MPAPSETSIANAALVLLGERRINSLEDNTKGARILRDRYDEVRDDVLRAHTWNFATKRAALAVNAVAPAWGFANAFDVPADFLRLIEIENRDSYPHQVEGRQIVTDHEGPLNILYTFKATVVIHFDPMFRQAFAAALAADVCEAFTGSNTKVEQCFALMDKKIKEARVPDGQEQSPQHVEASEYLDSREEQGFTRRIPTGGGSPL